MGVYETALCVVGAEGQSLLEAKLDTDGAAIATKLASEPAWALQEIATEARSAHHARSLHSLGLPVVAYETREVSKFTRIRLNKTDRNDALGRRMQADGPSDLH